MKISNALTLDEVKNIIDRYEYDNRSIAFYVDGKQVKKVATKNIDWAEDEMRDWITSNHTY